MSTPGTRGGSGQDSADVSAVSSVDLDEGRAT